jgi:hypothetical protein
MTREKITKLIEKTSNKNFKKSNCHDVWWFTDNLSAKIKRINGIYVVYGPNLYELHNLDEYKIEQINLFYDNVPGIHPCPYPQSYYEFCNLIKEPLHFFGKPEAYRQNSVNADINYYKSQYQNPVYKITKK